MPGAHRIMDLILALSLTPATSTGRAQDIPTSGGNLARLVGVREYTTAALLPLKYSARDIEVPAWVSIDSGYEDQNPRTAEKTITNSIGMKLTLIDAGQFRMGSGNDESDVSDDEKPKHSVRITQPFYLGTHEVTRGQFRRFVTDAGYRTEAEKDGKGGNGWNQETRKFEQNARYNWLSPGFDQTDEHPVVNVSWNDAQAFTAWLSQKEGKTYRLPTEAEWEYACRAGSKTCYSFGDDTAGLAAAGNIADGTAKETHPDWTWATTARDGYIYTAPVGRFTPNAWGLYDMHGNVREWCSDGYEADYYKRSPVDDPPGAAGALDRVIRGGSWFLNPRVARSAARYGFEPGLRTFGLGVRVVLVMSVRSDQGKRGESRRGAQARPAARRRLARFVGTGRAWAPASRGPDLR